MRLKRKQYIGKREFTNIAYIIQDNETKQECVYALANFFGSMYSNFNALSFASIALDSKQSESIKHDTPKQEQLQFSFAQPMLNESVA